MKPVFSTKGFHAFIICEAGPLVTIGQANESRRLRPPLPIVIPDVIYRAATGRQVVWSNPVTARAVLDWVRANDDVVRLAPTQAGLKHDMLFNLDAGDPSQADAAVIETVDSFYAGSADQRAILIFSDHASLSKQTDSQMRFASVGDLIDIGRTGLAIEPSIEDFEVGSIEGFERG